MFFFELNKSFIENLKTFLPSSVAIFLPYIVYFKLYVYFSGGGGGGLVITSFKANSVQLDWTGLERSLAIFTTELLFKLLKRLLMEKNTGFL